MRGTITAMTMTSRRVWTVGGDFRTRVPRIRLKSNRNAFSAISQSESHWSLCLAEVRDPA